MKHRSLLAALLMLWSGAPRGVGQAPPVITVTSTEQLYAEAEKSGNAGATLLVRTGRYAISRSLRLRARMNLVGENRYQDTDGDGVWDRATDGRWAVGGETVLDARAMAPSPATTRDCQLGGVTTENQEPAIVVGGGNRVRGITIQSPPQGVGVGEAAESDRSLVPSGDLVAAGIAFRIEDTVIEGGTRGATLGNRGCRAKQYRSALVFTRNVVVGTGVGLTLANFVTDQDDLIAGPSITAGVRGNRFVENETGLAALGGTQGTDGGLIELISTGNRFEGNTSSAMTIRAGVSQATARRPSSNGNFVRFSSAGDAFQANATPAVTLVGSDRLASGTNAGGENHRNQIEAVFLEPIIEGATTAVLAVGGRYRGADPAARSGTGNVVTLLVRSASDRSLSVQTEHNHPPPAIPVDPPNRVELIEGPSATDSRGGVAPGSGGSTPGRR